MPGFDGLGPSGDGPLTGRGRGYCAQPLADREGALQGFGRRRLNRSGRPRLGLGRGRGRGRARARRWW